MHWDNGWWVFGPWWMFPIVMPLVMIVIAVVTLMIFRVLFGAQGPWWPGSAPGAEQERAEDILRRRFASGEITEQEYQQKRRILRQP